MSHHLFSFVAVKPLCASIPTHNGSVQGLTDNGIVTGFNDGGQVWISRDEFPNSNLKFDRANNADPARSRGPPFIVSLKRSPRFGQFRRGAPADYSISVDNKRVSGRFQDAKTEIGKIRPETAARNLPVSARKHIKSAPRDRAEASLRAEFRDISVKSPNTPKYIFEPANGEFGLPQCRRS